MTSALSGCAGLADGASVDVLGPAIDALFKASEQCKLPAAGSFISVDLPCSAVSAIHSILLNLPDNALLVSQIDYESRVSGLSNNVAEYQALAAEYAARNKSLESLVSQLDGQVTTKTETITGLRNKLNEVTSSLASTKTQLLTVECEKREAIKLHLQAENFNQITRDENESLYSQNTNLRKELEIVREEYTKTKTELETRAFEGEKDKQKLSIAVSQIDWYQEEHAKNVSESSKQSKEQSSRARALEAEMQTLLCDKESLQSSLERVMQQYETAQQQLVELRLQVVELEGKIKVSETLYDTEMSALRNLVDKNKALAHEAKAYAESVEIELSKAEKDSEKQRLDHDLRVKTIQEKAAKALQAVEGYENTINEQKARIAELEALNNELSISAGTNEISKIYPASYIEGKAQETSMSYSQLWAEWVKQKGLINLLQSRVQELDSGIKSLVCEMEERGPAIIRLAQENTELTESHRLIATNNVELNKQITEFKREIKEIKLKLSQTEQELNLVKTWRGYISKQLIYLLSGMNANQVIKMIKTSFIDPQDLKTIEDDNLLFNDVQELIQRNQELLKRITELEEQNSLNSSEINTQNEQEIVKLKQEIVELKQEIVKFHDLKTIESSSRLEDLEIKCAHYDALIPGLEAKRVEADKRAVDRAQEATKLSAQVVCLKAEIASLNEKCNDLREQVRFAEGRCTTLSTSSLKWERMFEEKLAEIKLVNSEIANFERQLAAAKAERDIYQSTHNSLLESIAQCKGERDTLKNMLKDYKIEFQEQSQRSKSDIDRLNSEKDGLHVQVISLSTKLKEAADSEREAMRKLTKELHEMKNMQSELGRDKIIVNLESKPQKDNFDLQETVLESQNDLNYLRLELVEKTRSNQLLQTHCQEIEAQISAMQLVKQQDLDKLYDLQRQLEEKSLECQLKQQQVENTGIEKDELKSQIDAIQLIVKEHESEQASLKEKIDLLTRESESDRQLYTATILKHSKDLEALQTAKELVGELQNKLASVEIELEQAKTQQEAIKAEYQVQIQQLQDRIKHLNTRLELLQEQNTVLYESNGSVEESEKLLCYLRADRNALMVEKEAESIEYTRRIMQLERQISEYKDCLSKIESTQSLKIEQQRVSTELSIAMESNATLRRERQEMEERLKTLTITVEQVKNELLEARKDAATSAAFEKHAQQEMSKFKQEANDWRLKFTMMAKSDKVDVEQHTNEIEALKEQIALLVKEKETKSAQFDRAIKARNEKEQAKNEERVKIQSELEEFKSRAQEQEKRLEQLSVELQDYKSRAETQIAELTSELESKKTKLAALTTKMLYSRISQGQKAVLSSGSKISESEEPSTPQPATSELAESSIKSIPIPDALKISSITGKRSALDDLDTDKSKRACTESTLDVSAVKILTSQDSFESPITRPKAEKLAGFGKILNEAITAIVSENLEINACEQDAPEEKISEESKFSYKPIQLPQGINATSIEPPSVTVAVPKKHAVLHIASRGRGKPGRHGIEGKWPKVPKKT